MSIHTTIGEKHFMSDDVNRFKQTSCRTVCTFDGIDGKNPDAEFITRNGLREMTSLNLAYDAQQQESDKVLYKEFGIVNKKGTDAEVSIAVINGTVIFFKKANLTRFVAAMHLIKLWPSRTVDFREQEACLAMLTMVATWDHNKSVIEELITLGLFGDFQPCSSKYYSYAIKSELLRKRLKTNLRIETFTPDEEITMQLFKEAYELFVCYGIV
jgi:hypothetical protein